MRGRSFFFMNKLSHQKNDRLAWRSLCLGAHLKKIILIVLVLSQSLLCNAANPKNIELPQDPFDITRGYPYKSGGWSFYIVDSKYKKFMITIHDMYPKGRKPFLGLSPNHDRKKESEIDLSSELGQQLIGFLHAYVDSRLTKTTQDNFLKSGCNDFQGLEEGEKLISAQVLKALYWANGRPVVP